MKAIVINKFGDASDVFENVELAIPVHGDQEVLIKVLATSINPIDIHLRKGSMPALIPSFPAVLHGDVAGIVESVGAGVSQFKKGDAVFAWVGGFAASGGGLAEYLVVDYRLLAKTPDNITHREAAGVPLVALTAYEALFERAKVKLGDKVLIYGAVGGVGHMAVQFAKLAGAEVYAVVSKNEDIPKALSLGADHVINYNEESTDSFLQKYTGGEGFDVVFDTVGNENLASSLNTIKAYGTFVTTIAFAEVDLTPIHLKAANFHVVFLVIPIAYNLSERRARLGANLRVVSDWIQHGKVQVLIDPIEFLFQDIAEAHNYSEFTKSKGKVIISR